MATSFPLPVTFFGGLKVQACIFDLGESVANTQNAGGEVFTHSLGPRLWGGTITLRRDYHRDHAALKAQMDALRQPGRSFFAFPVDAAFPRLDPTGVILGAAAPTIQSVAGNNRDVTIQGLPAGYVLSVGDYIGWDYGGRVALHQLLAGGMANGSGVLSVEVSHPVRPTVTAGTAVRLIRPYCKAVLVPGSFMAGASERVFAAGAQFSFTQTLRT